MVSKSDYGEIEVNACKSVLLEIFHIFGEIKDEMVIVGGWTPSLLLPVSDEPHIGSLDIDIAFNFAEMPDGTYQTILKSFQDRGYTQDDDQPFRFFRKVKTEEGLMIIVEVDLLAGEYGETGKGRRTQKVLDAQARKARGCDLAFKSAVTVTLEGTLPEGRKDKVSFKVAGIVPFLVMKGMALHARMKEKDAYDIFYCIDNYPEGILKLSEEFQLHLKNGLTMEGLAKIRAKFASIEHVGPKWVADFHEVSDKDDREIIIRRVYEKVSELLDLLNVSEWEEKL